MAELEFQPRHWSATVALHVFDPERERRRDHAYQALANPIRRAVLRELSTGDRTVAQLAMIFPEEATTLPYHLRALRRGGLISARRVSTRESVYHVRRSFLSDLTANLQLVAGAS